MNANDILIGLGSIDEQLVHEAECAKANKPWRILKYAAPLAASLAIAFSLFSPKQNADITPSYKLQFGEASISSASRTQIKGHFWHDLTAAQADAALPIISQKHDLLGTVHYSSANGSTSLYEIRGSFAIGKTIRAEITIAPSEVIRDYVIVGEPIISQIEGTPIEAGLFITDKSSTGAQNYIYYASFKLGSISYYMELVSENKAADEAFTSLVADTILGGAADLSVFENPVLPKIIEQELTQAEAYSDPDFGKYLIKIPDGYLFNSANRRLNQNSNLLFASWSKGYNDARLQISALDAHSRERIVSPNNTELYDMSLYPIPWAESMPRDKYHIIENPVFRIEDLTLDMIKLRGYTRSEANDPSGSSLCAQFSVLYGDIVVEVRTEGISAEYLFAELAQLFD